MFTNRKPYFAVAFPTLVGIWREVRRGENTANKSLGTMQVWSKMTISPLSLEQSQNMKNIQNWVIF